MRFALIGDHPDGLAFARALHESGRHAVHTYCGPVEGADILRRFALEVPRQTDLEEVLADPAVEAAIVAAVGPNRATILRRCLQAERHVVCIHPADPSPDLAYEVGMIQSDVRTVLMPLMPWSVHPGVLRLIDAARAYPPGTPGGWRILEAEIGAVEEVLLDFNDVDAKPGVPGWDVLRMAGGEIVEIFAMTPTEEPTPGHPFVATGIFRSGGLFHVTGLPRQAEPSLRFSLVTTTHRCTLVFPQGWPGPAHWEGVDADGVMRSEEYATFDPWPRMIDAFEVALARVELARRSPPRPGVVATESLSDAKIALGWMDEIRALELDDNFRRSIVRRKSQTLDLQEATEEASFKGTMTLVGCSMIWLSVALLILSVWMPKAGWLIPATFGIFILVQAFRWVLPSGSPSKPAEGRGGPSQQILDESRRPRE